MLLRLFVFALAFVVIGVEAVATQTESKRWYIYKDADFLENHGEWTNVMPEQGSKMIRLNRVDTTDPASGSTSIRVDVRFAEPWWSGLAVASVADYWGEKPSTAAYNLQGARKLIFSARGARGGEGIQVRLGITGDKPYGDSLKLPASTRWLKLSKEWQRFELDLSGLDLKRVITPFVFVANRDYNPDGGLSFHLDEIYIEMGGR